MSDTILRLDLVKRRTGLSRSSIYAFIKNGDFPPPIKLGLRCVGWQSQEIDEWIASRVSATRGGSQ